MTFTDEKYTNILKGSLSDAKLKYFDARKYFVKEKKTFTIFLCFEIRFKVVHKI
jgi:hypothetical protein